MTGNRLGHGRNSNEVRGKHSRHSAEVSSQHTGCRTVLTYIACMINSVQWLCRCHLCIMSSCLKRRVSPIFLIPLTITCRQTFHFSGTSPDMLEACMTIRNAKTNLPDRVTGLPDLDFDRPTSACHTAVGGWQHCCERGSGVSTRLVDILLPVHTATIYSEHKTDRNQSLGLTPTQQYSNSTPQPR